MTDCIFCRLILGDLPAYTVYENEHVLAFLDIKPLSRGHTLVVPKKHVADLYDADKQTLGYLIEATQKVARAIVPAVGADGFNLGQNNGAAAGQVIFHLHFHVIPRFSGDGLSAWRHTEYQPGEIEEIKERIIKKLES